MFIYHVKGLFDQDTRASRGKHQEGWVAVIQFDKKKSQKLKNKKDRPLTISSSTNPIWYQVSQTPKTIDNTISHLQIHLHHLISNKLNKPLVSSGSKNLTPLKIDMIQQKKAQKRHAHLDQSCLKMTKNNWYFKNFVPLYIISFL